MASKDRGGLSKREYEKKYGKKFEGGESSSSLSKIVKSVLGVTPKDGVLPSFEDIYSSKLQEEDKKLAQSDMIPYYENQISLAMEDLNDYIANQNVSYQRTLRRARYTLAKGGGGIGTERDGVEKEVTQDNETAKNAAIKQTTRKVGTDKIQSTGYKPFGLFQEGALVGDMKTGIAEQELFYREQRLNRYNSDVEKINQAGTAKTY